MVAGSGPQLVRSLASACQERWTEAETDRWFSHIVLASLGEWLLHWGLEGLIKVPTEIVEEICGGTDDLAEWMSDHENKVALDLEEEARYRAPPSCN
jgi:hypothetical protein